MSSLRSLLTSEEVSLNVLATYRKKAAAAAKAKAGGKSNLKTRDAGESDSRCNNPLGGF